MLLLFDENIVMLGLYVLMMVPWSNDVHDIS